MKITDQERFEFIENKLRWCIFAPVDLPTAFEILRRMRRRGWSYQVERTTNEALHTCTLRFKDGDVSYVSEHRLPEVAILRCVYQALRGIKDKPGKGGV